MKTLIIVSGGDAPGINTVIARYTRLATSKGDQVVGAQSGFDGCLEGDIVDIPLSIINLLAGRGGTYLTSSRVPVLGEGDAKERLLSVLKQHSIDNLLLFGGDGTLRHVLPLLHSWNIPCLAIPTTIDNDVAGTDYTLGHDSACNFAFHAVEGALATAHALPGRIFMVETLGGNTGYLAMEVAQSVGAQIVLVPEYDVSLEWLAERLKLVMARDGHALVVLSEGMPFIAELPEAIPRLTGVRLRYIQLGHAQRGGDVSHRDRQFAHEISRKAYDAFKQGAQIGTFIVQDGKTTLFEGVLSGEKKAPPDYDLYRYINDL